MDDFKKANKGVDVTNRLIEIGDRVAAVFKYGDSAPNLILCEVIGFTRTKLRLRRLDYDDEATKYPHQCVRVDYTKPGDLVLILKEN
jgi:hypothetical protein